MNWFRTIIKPTRRIAQPECHWFTSAAHDPMNSPLGEHEHGVVRRLASEAVTANGLVLAFEDFGACTWRVN